MTTYRQKLARSLARGNNAEYERTLRSSIQASDHSKTTDKSLKAEVKLSGRNTTTGNYLEELERHDGAISGRKNSQAVFKTSFSKGAFHPNFGRSSGFTEDILKTDNILTQSSNKHLLHRDEQIHREDSRAFLNDPMKPRNDYSPNLSGFKDRKVSPIVSANITIF